MFRKLALAGAMVATVSLIAIAATPLHTYNNSVGTEQETIGVHCINNTTGEPESCGTGGGGGGDATAANQVTTNTEIGGLTEAAPGTDTASSGLNGRLQRVAQRLTSMITALTNTIVLQAGENHVGEVGNNQITITAAQTSTVVTYTTGQAIGGLITYANAARVSGATGAPGTSGLIQRAMVFSKITNTVQTDIILFNANPTGSTCTNASAYSLAAADFDKVIGVAHVTDWTASASAYTGQAQNLAIPYALVSNTSLFGCLVARGSITAASTSDFSTAAAVIRN